MRGAGGTCEILPEGGYCRFRGHEVSRFRFRRMGFAHTWSFIRLWFRPGAGRNGAQVKCHSANGATHTQPWAKPKGMGRDVRGCSGPSDGTPRTRQQT